MHAKSSKLALLPVAALLCVFSGCGTVGQPRADGTSPEAPGHSAAHDEAVQRVIDGSIFEMKGDYARAILEYQEALRREKDAGIYYALSRNYAWLAKYPLAIEAGKEAVSRSPEMLPYRRNLAEIYAMAYEVDAAAGEYREVIARDSGAIDAWYALARMYQSKRPLDALDVYTRFLERFGPDWNVLLQMGEMYTKLGQFQKAAGAMQQMADMDPGNRALQRTLAESYIRAEEYAPALAIYQRLYELDPDDLSLRAEMAGIYLEQRKYGEAQPHIAAILNADSLSLEVKLRLGEICFGQIEKDSTYAPTARMVFERLRAANPKDWRPYWFLGAIGALTRDDTLSINNFRKVTEIAGWNADAWVYLSSIFFRNNNFEDMARVLESARKVLPEEFRVNFYLGVAYNRLGRHQDAALALEHARRINPKDVEAISELAIVYESLKQFAETDSLYELALRLAPANATILNNYGYSLSERGIQLERALGMAKKAVEAEPDNSSFLDTIGWIYFKLGDYQEAEGFIKKAVSKGDASAVVLEHLGDVYFRLNDVDRALANWNMALALDKNNSALKEKIARKSL
jgi:tetratricopeptide (TPR) repeat protein